MLQCITTRSDVFAIVISDSLLIQVAGLGIKWDERFKCIQQWWLHFQWPQAACTTVVLSHIKHHAWHTCLFLCCYERLYIVTWDNYVRTWVNNVLLEELFGAFVQLLENIKTPFAMSLSTKCCWCGWSIIFLICYCNKNNNNKK